MFICGQEYKLNTINITWINIRYVLIMYDVESIWRRKTQTNRLIHSYKELSELRSDIRLLYHKFELRSTRYNTNWQLKEKVLFSFVHKVSKMSLAHTCLLFNS